jgi:uncharacterized membrane protein YfcA
VTSTLRAGVRDDAAVTSLTLQTAFNSTFSWSARRLRRSIRLQEGNAWAIGGVISANSTLACSFGDNFYSNIRNPNIMSFVLGRVPDASRR